MPKTETAAYTTERQKLQTSPVLFVRFSHVKKAGDGTDYPFSRDFATAAVTGSTKEKLLALRRISGNVQTVDPIQGRSSFGSFSVELLDLQGEIGKHLAAPALTLAQPMTAGQLTAEVSQDPSGLPSKGTIEITAGSAIERAQYTSYNASTKVITLSARGADGTTAAAHNIGDAVTNGEQIRPGQRCQIWAGYAPLNETDYRSETKMEVVNRQLADDWVTFVVQIADMQRGLKRQLFTGATRDAPVTLTGNPVTLALQVLTSTGAGTNGVYDVLPAPNGLAIPQALIDVAGLESLRDTEFIGQIYDLKLNAPEDGKEWVEREIWRTLNCIPFLKQDGKYSAKRLKPAPDPSTVTFTLTEDDIIAWRWRSGDPLIVNQVDFRYDWNLTDNPDFWGKRQLYTSTASADKHGKRLAPAIESKGIKTASGGQTILDDRAAQLFKRFADPPPIPEIHCFYSKNNAELGEPVKITHSKIYNHRTGLRGLTNEVFEVIDLRPLYGEEGRIILTCLHTGAITLPSAPTSGGPITTPNPERDTTPPAVPTGLNVTPTGEVKDDGTFIGILDVTWTANAESDIGYYVIEYRKQGTAAFQSVYAPKEASPRKILRPLEPSTTYEVRVAAVDTSTNPSGVSTIFTATTPASPGAPSIPTGVGAGAFITDIRVAWNVNPETDISGYIVERADDAAFTVSVVTRASNHQSTFFLDPGLGSNVSKYYRIKATRRTNVSSVASAVVSATTPGIGTSDTASGLKFIEVVSVLPGAGAQGRTVFLTTDNKLYRDTGSAWTRMVHGTDDITADSITAGAIAAGAIGASEVAANIINSGHLRTDTAVISVAAQIASLIVHGTTHMVDVSIDNLKVKDLTLGTSKAQADAWSQSAYVRSDAAYTITSNSVEEVIDSVTITTVGGRVEVFFKIDFSVADGQGFKFRVRRDSAEIEFYQFDYIVSNERLDSFLLDAPLAGTYTYKLTGILMPSATPTTVSHRRLMVVEAKK